MPQFELEDIGSDRPPERIRGRSALEAAAGHYSLEDTSILTIAPASGFEGLSGWQDVSVGGKLVARIRPYQRMKFRRA